MQWELIESACFSALEGSLNSFKNWKLTESLPFEQSLYICEVFPLRQVFPWSGLRLHWRPSHGSIPRHCSGGQHPSMCPGFHLCMSGYGQHCSASWLSLLNFSSTEKKKKSKIINNLQVKPCFYALCLDISGYENISIHLRFIQCAHFSKTVVILNICHWLLALEVFCCIQALVHHR